MSEMQTLLALPEKEAAQTIAALLWSRNGHQRSLDDEAFDRVIVDSIAPAALTKTFQNYGWPWPMIVIESASSDPWNAQKWRCALDRWTVSIGLPNAAGARTRTAVHIAWQNTLAVIAAYFVLGCIVAAIYRLTARRRLRHRQNRNLCPHCAYPIPTRVSTPQATLP